MSDSQTDNLNSVNSHRELNRVRKVDLHVASERRLDRLDERGQRGGLFSFTKRAEGHERTPSTGPLEGVSNGGGPPSWDIWRGTVAFGKCIRHNVVKGTIEQYPTAGSAREAVNGLRTHINAFHNLQRHQLISLGDLIDHYLNKELADHVTWPSHATRLVYREFLRR